ncbi:MAG: helix-turn-helix domain-containing protein [Niastella sp.]|nr:helix-turn-helix domain-containing protein [Niastella sp.]
MHQNVLIIARSKEAHRSIFNKLSTDFHVFAAKDSPHALKTIQKHLIDLIIFVAAEKPETEIRLCRELKSNQLCDHIPVILITPEDNLQVRIKSLEAGADVHMSCPLFREYLDVQIRSLIANRLKIRRHFKQVPEMAERASNLQEKEQIRKRLTDCLFDETTQKDLTVDQLARLMHMSRPTLYRKMKYVTNLTPNELINEARLRKAAELLASGQYRASEVAHMVGYCSHSSFGKSFLKQFGVTPATYQRMKKIMNAA